MTFTPILLSIPRVKVFFDGVVGFRLNRKLCRAFSQQANRLAVNIPVLPGLLRVNRKAEKMRKVDELEIMNYNFKVSNKGNQ